jgi:hypothetical protein
MFEKASRLKLRFATSKGLLSLEDLWDIPLTSKNGVSLDDVAKGLSKTLKESDTESFVVKSVKTDPTVALAFEIVKHIITVRLAEDEAKATAAANRKKKQDILALIAGKENEQLAGSSLEDLRKLADSL